MRYAKFLLLVLVAFLIFENSGNFFPKKEPVSPIIKNVFSTKRIIVQFSPGTPLEVRKAFFVKMGFTPVEFDVFGYDIAELDPDYAESLRFSLRERFSYFLKSEQKPKDPSILDYQIEQKQKRLIPQAGCNANEPEKKPGTRAIVPWYDETIGVSRAHAFLRDKKIKLLPQGVVIVDNGPVFSHPDILPALKKDSDGNIIFWSKNKKLFKAGDHGTHVACLAAAYRDGKGMEGIAGQNAYILPLIVNYKDENYFFTSDVAIGLKYLKQMEDEGKVSWRVVNMSFALYEEIRVFRAAIRELHDKLFVAAAGNEEDDLEKVKLYPASWRFSNVMAVAAINTGEQLAYFSNFGKEAVDIAAPGTNIISCVGESGYRNMQGTSMAAPITAGAAALVFSFNESFSPSHVKAILFFSARYLKSLDGKVKDSRLVNVYEAVKLTYETESSPL
ncbi:MAG: S8 family serine peptidase [Patescibacteria group bacterium]